MPAEVYDMPQQTPAIDTAQSIAKMILGVQQRAFRHFCAKPIDHFSQAVLAGGADKECSFEITPCVHIGGGV